MQTKRFSIEYAVDPKLHNFGGQHYEFLYPDDLIREVMMLLGLPENRHEESKKTILAAAGVYEIVKRSTAKEFAHSRERRALADLSQKAKQFVKALKKVKTTGHALSNMMSYGVDRPPFGSISLTLPDTGLILTLSDIADKASKVKTPYARTTKSKKYLSWVRNLSPLFEGAKIPLSIDSFYVDGKSRSVRALVRLMMPLDPETTDQQIAEAIKVFNKEKNQNNH